MRGIAYGALPCTAAGCGGQGLPSEDMLQVGYEEQWGAKGRDDLGIMAKLGSNAVRLYHSLGLGAKRDHTGFLDYAALLGLNVMPGYHTESANNNGECPKFDCFETWKTATLEGFEHGFRKEDTWHPAVAALVLLNEPDFFETAPKCQPQGAWCRVKAALSALDGVLAAEKEAGVGAGRVKFTVTWSFGMRASIDGKVIGPGIFGFQDMVAGIQDPQIAQYTPRCSQGELQEAFRTRWVHGVNTQAPWSYVRDVISKDYSQFLPTPWFIGEYGANGQDAATIQADLESMQEHASEGSAFLGAAFFQFQTTYWKGGAEKNFGLFGLGETQIGKTGEVCDRVASHCRPWPVHCLTTDLSWLPGDKAHRARALATAWHGSIDGASLCSVGRRLVEGGAIGTKLAFQIHGAAFPDGAAVLDAKLDTAELTRRITARTLALLGNESVALQGELSLESGGARSIDETPDEPVPKSGSQLSWRGWALAGAVAVLLAAGSAAICCVARRRKAPRRSAASSCVEQAV